MNCAEIRSELLAAARGRLDPETDAAVAAHLDVCAACSQARLSERALDEALERALPRYTAPASLKRRLALMAGPGQRPAERRVRLRVPSRVLGAAASIALVLGGALWWRARPALDPAEPLVAELVNDHLRVLARERPVDVEAHGAHEVKPWFEGKLEFAPDVPSPTVPDLQLRGGAVGYVFDQKSAVVLYALRRHAVTLLVTRATGSTAAGVGPTPIRQRSLRGFHVAWWRAGDLQYALVSDVNAGELSALADRFASETAPNVTR